MAQEPGEGPDPAVGFLGDRCAQLDLFSREEGFDPVWLRNAVEEPLSEADLLEGGEP